MKFLTESWIIHGFALLHGAVALGCRLAGLPDEMMLTLLTMLMVVLLCLRCRVSGMLMAVSVILVNILGVLLGRGTSWLFGLVASSPLVIYPLSTLVSTEIIGWSMLGVARGVARRHPVPPEKMASSLKWLLVTFVVILVTRLAILLLTRNSWTGQNTAISILLDYSLTLAVVVALAEYALRQQQQARTASEEANLAQYRYHKLKQQVNPHFLFNSLNVLDFMIQEQSSEEASRYTHKLAEVYRYMIKNEDETTVRLRDEMDFVGLYVDLLQVRFPVGIEVETDIPEAAYSRSLVPCCVQLLIENALKHNAVSAERPLRIRITATRDSVTVTNNRTPKVTRVASTGLGLKYIRQQYKDLSGQSVQVREEEDLYAVTVPLL